MPTIQLDRKSFEKHVGKKLPLEKLKDRISYLGTDLEQVTDSIIDVEVFPNRPDMLSVQGFARAFSSFIGHKPGLRGYKAKASKERVIIEKAVSKVRPYTVCAIVRNLSLDDERIKEIIDIQEKLHGTYGRNRKKVAIGIYPLDKIALPITFTARPPEEITFHPLDGEREMTAVEILAEHPTGQKYGHLLDGSKLFPVFLDANKEVLSVPPIINSMKTGRITETTKEAFIECSGFDYGYLSRALNMILTALADMGADIQSMTLEYPDKKVSSPDFSPQEMDLDLDYVNKRLGLELPKKEALALLEKMGYGQKDGKVLVPCYRADILHQADLAEDIAIAYGYENFEDIIPNVATVGREHPFEVFRNKVADLLVGCSYQEVAVYHLTNKEKQDDRMGTDSRAITLSNAISLEYDTLRSWTIPSLLEVFTSNKHHEYPQAIFTTSTAFLKDKDAETGVREEKRLALATSHEKAAFNDIRGIVEYILRSLALEGKIKERDHPSFIQGRCAEILAKDTSLGFFGEISPAVLQNWNLEQPVVVGELHLDKLFELAGKR